MSTSLPILHFNDVYRVNPQKLSGGATIDVTQFAHMLDELRERWPVREDGKRDGLVLFSGDLFAPSVESSVTRGSHMVPVINELAPDVAVTGNHDFDFGYPHLTKLLNDTKFPWLLSNIIDETTSRIPEHLHEFYITDRCGVRIGFIGLVESEWITTVPAWPSNFKYRDMVEVALDLSKRLRDPQGEYKCDLIIALTHSRIPNDIRLAKGINALSPSHQPADFATTHGADIILGGHDHVYYASKGVTSWEGYDVNQEVLGAEQDEGDVLVAKSGTDFRELSEVVLELEDTPSGSVRRKVIKCVKGKRHETKPGSPSSQRLKEVLSKILDSVSETMKKPVCYATEKLDLRSEYIRTEESASGDWFADVIHHAYDDALCNMGIESADGVFLCAGALRGDTVYGPGLVTLGDILEILPFEDSILVLELDGRTIWEAFEAGLATWPAQEGRFPVISGFRVTWDSRKPPGQRVLNIAVQTHKRIDPNKSGDSTPNLLIDHEEVKRGRGGRKYVVITREYMAQGHDGFECLKDQKMLIDDEQGQMMSTIVRKYLLGSKYINKMNRAVEQTEKDKTEHPKVAHLHAETERILQNAKHRAERLSKETSLRARDHWHQAINHVREILHSPAFYRAPLAVARREHMGSTDCFDGDHVRSGEKQQRTTEEMEDEDLPEITPVVDGRLKDVGRT
ncbi:Metallo-dependent phosphatase [Fomitiporia mediterranea MF3/22]|uniref:Metallo-dependent phosphatase n=1 Tax=Fomitiporia mediterranea (strain MF3/22) TaxID=694068 RepID=UPI00044096CC|nr:Metallo-dependent phosphatase [Fomitiporia mediterranea MF3/22]EJD02121.1 Metallo-dependent phosphatase [Fomitiporia mediterranea MF3/22]